MEPFKIALPLVGLVDPYVDAGSLLKAAKEGGQQARFAIARLWLSEGIPFAFRECPAIYESIRAWLSTLLEVHAKEINLGGSARLGSSIARTKVGKRFDDNSDLDLFVVSEHLFTRIKEDFLRWAIDFESGILVPRNDNEVGFWNENGKRGQILIQRGFLDSWMVPNLEQYSTAKRVSQLMWLLVEKLKITERAPKPRKASIRCYDSWDSYCRQINLNLS